MDLAYVLWGWCREQGVYLAVDERVTTQNLLCFALSLRGLFGHIIWRLLGQKIAPSPR